MRSDEKLTAFVELEIDESSEIKSVGRKRIDAMWLKEFVKEHRKVEDLEANAAQQRKEITALLATVKEQASQIQKASAVHQSA